MARTLSTVAALFAAVAVAWPAMPALAEQTFKPPCAYKAWNNGSNTKVVLALDDQCRLTRIYAKTLQSRVGHFSFWGPRGTAGIPDSPEGTYAPNRGWVQHVNQQAAADQLWCARFWERQGGSWVDIDTNCVTVREPW